MIALSKDDRRKLELAGLILPSEPDATPRARPRIYPRNRPTVQACRERGLCIECRCARADVGLRCTPCVEYRRKRRREYYGRTGG